MELEASPEPGPDEERALREALGAVAEPEESAWWRAGLPGGADESD